MTDKARIKIAAVVTALFLGAISLAGIATRADAPKAVSAAPVTAVSPRPAATVPTGTAGEYEDDERGEHNE
jgi:hypothetical protein